MIFLSRIYPLPDERKSFLERVIEPALVGIIATAVGGVVLAIFLTWYAPDKSTENSGVTSSEEMPQSVDTKDADEDVYRSFWKMNVK